MMQITPRILADMVGATVEGDDSIAITGFAKIEEAKPGDVSFIANPKYEHFIDNTHASALLVSTRFRPRHDGDPVLIKVEDPYASLAFLLSAFESMKPQKTGIEQPCHLGAGVEVREGSYVGAFAYIGDGVRLGRNVKIYPQAYIGDGVEIGDDTVIRAGVRVYEGCKIGSRCILHSGVVIGADGFGFAPKDGEYEKIPQIGNVVIEDDVEIGANTTVDRATFGSTVIGKGTKLDNLIQVAHNVVIGKHNVAAAQVGFAGSSKIGDHNMFGGQVGVSGHITIGNFNQIGAQSGIPNNVGDNNRLMGYPAVDARMFARNVFYMKHLGEMYNQLQTLIKSCKETSGN